MHAATAVSGSAPAYLYAFVEALEAAGAGQGLDPAASAKLARATIVGAAALLGRAARSRPNCASRSPRPAARRRRRWAVLMGEGGFGDLLPKALDAAVKRSVELGG
jgi:pyrroline-5-carboxylate reductase